MPAISFIDGKEVEWADISVNIAGGSTVKFEAIEYGVDTEKEHLHAGGDDPISIQSGNRKPAGSVTLLKGAYDVLDDAAIAAGGRDVTDLQMDVIVYYKPKGSRPPRTETLVGCEISSFKKKMNQGDKKMAIELPFLFLQRIPS